MMYARTLSHLSIVLLSFTALCTSVYAEDVTCIDPANCKDNLYGRSLQDSTVEKVNIGANTESTVSPQHGGELFAISVDGEHVAGTKVPQDIQRKTDLALEAVDIQVKYDGLDTKPILNVSTFPIRRTYMAGETINFLASNNYPGWLEKSEILIFDAKEAKRSTPIATVSVSPSGAATWAMPSDNSGQYVYVLRVYDGEGRYDETVPLRLLRTAQKLANHEPSGDAVAPGYSEDRTAIRNIPVFGGSVTVFGRGLPEGVNATVLGDQIPVDNEGNFVIQRILPPGDHAVDVELQGAGNNALTFNRSINIPSNEWFYVALADLTVGRRIGSDNIEAVNPGEFDKTYTKGRLAFYLKGKIKGRYLLTAAGDTGEGSLKTMLKGLDAKDPKQFLRRLDPDDYYPIYGDDSSAVEDAPTRGKFYVRLERGDSHVMWGNYKTQIRGTEFLRNERSLYGASGVYKSEATTSSGERQTEVHVYAAQPGSLPQRDVLRGTGGSAYFLKHQDITIGSETLSVEIRDPVSGRVIDRRTLRYGEDYDFDYIQGVVLLKTPLASTTSSGAVVQSGALGGNEVYLIANYEYAPSSGEVDGYTYGGRSQQWLGDHVRVGATVAVEKTGSANQNLAGIDIQVRKSDLTFIEAEIASSKGPGFGSSISSDGGLTISDKTSTGSADRVARAYRLHGRAALGELTNDEFQGNIEGYFEKFDQGFSTLDRQIDKAKILWGMSGEIEISEKTDLGFSYDESDVNGGAQSRELAADMTHSLSAAWEMSIGVKNTLQEDVVRIIDGSRTDVGGRIKHNFDENNSISVFGQATVQRKGNIRENNRVGIGATAQLTQKLGAQAEASYGTTGFGARATLDYKPTADDHYYLGYRLDPDRENANDFSGQLQGDDLGAIVAGVRHSYSERLSVYAEDNYDMFGSKQSLTQTYGVNYTPDATWSFGGGTEIGTIWDNSINAGTGIKNSDFERTAISLSMGYHPGEKVDANIKGEVRFEDSEDNTRDMDSYLLSAGVGYSVIEGWRLIADIDAVFSDATVTQRDGEYIEASLGYAYRATTNDKVNALFKYTFLFDNPGADQVTVSGSTLGASQMSHILSADVNYDINEIITLGAKYGFRIGETRDRAAGSDWEKSSAHIAILRADLSVVKNWDALLEGRVLWTPENETADFGFLAAAYRSMGDNFKLGAGYNFGSFSDDLRDLEADDHGVFINAIGKF